MEIFLDQIFPTLIIPTFKDPDDLGMLQSLQEHRLFFEVAHFSGLRSEAPHKNFAGKRTGVGDTPYLV